MKPVNLDTEKLTKIGGVSISALDVKAIENAASWLRHWEYDEKVEGAVPSASTKNPDGTGYKLLRIQATAEKLRGLLNDDSTGGRAATSLLGAGFEGSNVDMWQHPLCADLDSLLDRAAQEIERCRQESKQNPKGQSVTTEARKQLIAVITRSWLDAGGSPRDARRFTNWDEKNKPTELMELTWHVIQNALPPGSQISWEQLDSDIKDCLPEHAG
jgi:hypothetical protein